MRFDFERASDRDHVATVRHVVALTDLTSMQSRRLPDDVRDLLEKHRAMQ
jgi:acyl-CoA thioesterase FadM